MCCRPLCPIIGEADPRSHDDDDGPGPLLRQPGEGPLILGP